MGEEKTAHDSAALVGRHKVLVLTLLLFFLLSLHLVKQDLQGKGSEKEVVPLFFIFNITSPSTEQCCPRFTMIHI